MHKPYTLKLELTRGCTRRCVFCALPEMAYKDEVSCMPKDVFEAAIVKSAAVWPKIRIELAERGEPTLNPNVFEYITFARENYPKAQIMLTTNGDVMWKDKEGVQNYVQNLLDCGLNILMIDCYSDSRYEAMITALPNATLFDPHGNHPYRYYSPTYKSVILTHTVPGTPKDIIRHFHNAGGFVNVKKARDAGYTVQDAPEPLKKMCVRPFRELVVHYNGNVPMCCNDWADEYVVGNILHNPILKLWEALDPYRRILIAKDRAANNVCRKCSDRSGFRVGLETGWFNI